jgi:hypothetical protein
LSSKFVELAEVVGNKYERTNMNIGLQHHQKQDICWEKIFQHKNSNPQHKNNDLGQDIKKLVEIPNRLQ